MESLDFGRVFEVSKHSHSSFGCGCDPRGGASFGWELVSFEWTRRDCTAHRRSGGGGRDRRRQCDGAAEPVIMHAGGW